MEEIIIAKPDAQTLVTVYEHWTPEWMEAYTLDESGKKTILFQGKNSYGLVPYVIVKTNEPQW